VCGWSGASAFASYAACVQEAKKAGIAAPCLPLIVDATVVAGSYAEARSRAGAAAWELRWPPIRCAAARRPAVASTGSNTVSAT